MNIKKTSRVSWFAQFFTPANRVEGFVQKTFYVTSLLIIANLVGLFVLKHYDASLAILVASAIASTGAGILVEYFLSLAPSQKKQPGGDNSVEKTE